MGGIAKREKVARVWVPWYRDMVFITIATLVFVVDQFTKYLVRVNLAFGEAIPDDGFIRIVHTYNTGSAFGLFRGQTPWSASESCSWYTVILPSLRRYYVLAWGFRSAGRQATCWTG